jgi:xylan 1,4-beta-xylosidase
VVENFAPEGPKLLRRGAWFYLVTAIGGTAGPVTGHMVIAARSKSIHGPWEHCPHNPLVRTVSTAEPWWSRGHATLVEGLPGTGGWSITAENGMRTLGRQTLLEPIEWTATAGSVPRVAIFRSPCASRGAASPAHRRRACRMISPRTAWVCNGASMHPSDEGSGRAMALAADHRGERSLSGGSSPLTCLVGDRGYQAEVSIDLNGKVEAGLLLFYNYKAFVGVGFTPEKLKIYEYSEEPLGGGAASARSLRLRMTNDENVLTWHYSHDEGQSWQRHGTRMEVSGIHHNVFGGFLSLRLGLYVAGEGGAKLRDFRYRARV